MKPDRLEIDFMPSRGLAFTRAGAVLAGLALIPVPYTHLPLPTNRKV